MSLEHYGTQTRMEEPEVRIVGPEIRKLDGYLRDVVGWKVSVVLTYVHHSYSFAVTNGSLVLLRVHSRAHQYRRRRVGSK